ncbi:CPCC family cysteine-rich protein [Chryseobacterium sp.]|uniref:CPCC family cysteine-rich protein n=1 Tax=Chryseobacterium sp. TaxID=1871047 RepID=UPI0028A221AF|nr:CPCC family cysteine-rich protein [Chryseobacterium sp.]
MNNENDNLNVQCYCCGFITIEERGNYQICPVCFWEDDGCYELNKESGSNHMTLEEGRKNFEKFGACEERFVKNVVKNPESRFGRENI